MALRLVQWFGGKGLRWRWILENLPSGRVYVEPFGGAASLLLNKPPHPVEVYNDLNGDLVNLFRAVQDEARFEKLKWRLEWTLYSYDEFRRARRILAESQDPDERAWAFYVACTQGFSGQSRHDGNWSRAFVSTVGMAENTSRWINGIAKLPLIRKRLMRVQIDNRDGLEVIRYWDSAETIFYIDPPYPHGTRTDDDDYACEMSDEQHAALIDLLLSVRGNYALSTYPNPLYERLLQDQSVRKVERNTVAHAAGRTRISGIRGTGRAMAKVPRIEVLYVRHKNGGQRSLFDAAG
ncbi:MAG: DNA methyltransferase [Chloroflexus sp.]|nr:MAG: DNA methyltransferase [Chloroflexus sp.]